MSRTLACVQAHDNQDHHAHPRVILRIASERIRGGTCYLRGAQCPFEEISRRRMVGQSAQILANKWIVRSIGQRAASSNITESQPTARITDNPTSDRDGGEGSSLWRAFIIGSSQDRKIMSFVAVAWDVVVVVNGGTWGGELVIIGMTTRAASRARHRDYQDMRLESRHPQPVSRGPDSAIYLSARERTCVCARACGRSMTERVPDRLSVNRFPPAWPGAIAQDSAWFGGGLSRSTGYKNFEPRWFLLLPALWGFELLFTRCGGSKEEEADVVVLVERLFTNPHSGIWTGLDWTGLDYSMDLGKRHGHPSRSPPPAPPPPTPLFLLEIAPWSGP
ncbi:hypothetical protein BKA81DRAFT_375594 [Phyllosticta paracitricarpa]